MTQNLGHVERTLPLQGALVVRVTLFPEEFDSTPNIVGYLDFKHNVTGCTDFKPHLTERGYLDATSCPHLPATPNLNILAVI